MEAVAQIEMPLDLQCGSYVFGQWRGPPEGSQCSARLHPTLPERGVMDRGLVPVGGGVRGGEEDEKLQTKGKGSR